MQRGCWEKRSKGASSIPRLAATEEEKERIAARKGAFINVHETLRRGETAGGRKKKKKK